MKKTLSLLLMMLALAFALVACGGGDSEEAASGDSSDSGETTENENASEDSGDKIELRMAWWGGEDRHARTLEVIEMYEKENPNIDIVAEYSGMDGYFDKLTTQFAASNAPDIIQYGGNLNDFVYRDVVLPLNEYVESGVIDISKHDKKMIESATFDDELYGVTLGTNAFGVLLNKTKFEEAGVELPSREWTWDDFEEITATLTENLDNTYGTAYFEEDGFGLFIDQEGYVLHENGDLKIDKELVTSWFELWKGIDEAGGLVPPEIQAESSKTPELSLIVGGQAAIQAAASNQLGAYQGATEDEIVLWNPPYNDEGSHGSSLRPSQYLAGYAGTEHPEEVAKFLNFFTNDPEAGAILGNDRGAPVNSDVRQAIIESADETDAQIFEFIEYVSSTSDSPFVPNLPGYNETSAVFLTVSQDIFFEQTSIEEGVDYYWEELNRILDENKPE